MEELKKLAAITALNNMMSKDWFDICTIDSVARVLNVNPKGDAYDVLHTLHCIHFNKMPPQLRDEIPALIRQCLGVEPVYQFKTLDKELIEVNATNATVKRGGLLRLIGR